ncbi:S41 family peptidase [Asanoa sp. WMMD1127]|uniref:S41 family peptidase n=1 Tax=Asanoa sp. WMMD1127 TaxID=3016107 RepID=UPI002416D620|nr:S41 family peptidase [Asanoa sp. WMMD1127]MDG4826340.1 S41 family peptidase [Asanoa sp. WMMD1127]
MTIETGTATVGDVAGRLVGWLERLMPDGARRDALTAALTAGFGGDAAPISAAGCAAIERVAWKWARHVALFWEPGGTAPADTEAGAWPPPDPGAVRSRAAGVSNVRRLDDGTGVVRIDTLDAIGLAQPFVDAAFGLVRGARRIVLDLRGNGGGDPATVALIAGWLLGDRAVRLSDVVDRAGTRQWWTPDRAPGTALRQDAFVLVGPGTFSSGEALAYHLQARERVTVVGEATPGAADHVLPIRLAPTVLAHVPRAYVVDAVTGANWEGTGVIPDVPCPADDALEKLPG